DGQARTVQRMNEAHFASTGRTVSDTGAARLEIVEVAAGRNFAVRVLTGQPDFDVVALGRREAHVAGRMDDDAIGELETLQYFFRVVRQGFEFGAGIFGT